MYLMDIDAVEKPSAFIVPISARWSSTILVMEVRELSAATRKKIRGNTSARFPIRSESEENST